MVEETFEEEALVAIRVGVLRYVEAERLVPDAEVKFILDTVVDPRVEVAETVRYPEISRLVVEAFTVIRLVDEARPDGRISKRICPELEAAWSQSAAWPARPWRYKVEVPTLVDWM